jgi:ADP-ribosyl-[dinitrogen reductase] hydrolase
VTRAAKTSLTHPLPIAAVATAGGGAIGMTLCPGKRQPEAVTGPWDRDLAADLAAIASFGADAVITAMENDELVAAAVPAPVLAAAVRAAGMGWHHWPIVDFAAPGPAFEDAWTREAPALCATLGAGGRVLVHCRGGRGRSGVIAARFLIELGMGAEKAIAAVRRAQPLAIETPVQEQHVRAYRPSLGVRPHGRTK